MSNTKTSRSHAVVRFAISAALLLLASVIYINRQYLNDAITVWSYEPSSSVSTIAKNLHLTEKGKFIFYATRPAVEDRATFNRECPRQEEKTPILGCYTKEDRIYVYDLTNEQLDGMEEVTAAHELLHAVWYRMSDSERRKIAIELRAAYHRVATEELKSRMEYYERTEPGETDNELHSILGTEFSTLGEPLESYYSQYFNRSTVLAYHKKYSQLYSSLFAQADDLYEKMQVLSASIESRTRAYEDALRQYSVDVTTFNNRANSGWFTSQSQFYSQRAALAARSTALNKERLSINGDIETYNKYYVRYQEIAQQVEVLNKSIDSFNEIDQAPSV